VIPGAQQAERGSFHLHDRAKHVLALDRRANAIDMARQQSHTERFLEILNPPPQGIDRLAARL
jgi:hypothetical protein